VDAVGAIEWQRLLGGSGMDRAASVLETADSGYIVLGDSFSSESGDVQSTGSGVFPMYDIRQFKPALYVVVLLGLTCFALAGDSPGLWAFCTLAISLNAWLVFTGRFSPLPRWLASVITIAAVLYVIVQIRTFGGPPLMFIGQFLALLQIVKLYEQRLNRDYAQVLVLSLLLIVAASINTASLLFAALMAIYLVVSLYCCLLFHLKVEADRAKAAFPILPEKVSPATIQQDQRYLPSSMRRLTTLISIFAAVMAVLVFLFFPRGAGLGVLGQLQFKPTSALTGFSDTVRFDQINRIKQNDQIVARVTVYRDDKRIEGTETLLLRGLTLDAYNPDYNRDPNRRRRYQWTRARYRIREDALNDERELRTFLTADSSAYRQHIRLEPTETRYLFAMPGVVSVKTARPINVSYSPADESLQIDALNTPLEYDVVSTNQPGRPDMLGLLVSQIRMSPPRSDPAVLDAIRAYTLQEQVTNGLAAQRSRLYAVQESNEEIARRIEQHLRTNFAYTLDLTDVEAEFRNNEPVLTFLTKVKRGHCEYFASAMTLMCQSIGIPARMVIGFRCDADAYSPFGYYIVTQAHAHTWVEVLTPRGWVVFDPTSSRDADAARATTLWRSVRQFFDFLEYKWAENVVAYDTKDRDNILRNLDTVMTQKAIQTTGVFAQVSKWFRNLGDNTAFWSEFYQIWFNALSILVALMLIGIIAVIGVYLVQQERLRRLAHRIGIGALPPGQQLRLARQLAFYDQLTRVLHRQQILRPNYMTQQEFADSLSFLPHQTYEIIRRLTRLFYRVRFGDAHLNPHRQRRLEEVVRRLAESFDRSPSRH
jgi:transglutaminase-like putative cysteine protease